VIVWLGGYGSMYSILWSISLKLRDPCPFDVVEMVNWPEVLVKEGPLDTVDTPQPVATATSTTKMMMFGPNLTRLRSTLAQK
jgi:hypothetical protein